MNKILFFLCCFSFGGYIAICAMYSQDNLIAFDQMRLKRVDKELGIAKAEMDEDEADWHLTYLYQIIIS